ncbi:MAG: hypothetical protein H6Q89_5414, partial [Myxococcaceae bacterium]|nr:hypothetical protein [Myxococcaceae bacterium]
MNCRSRLHLWVVFPFLAAGCIDFGGAQNAYCESHPAACADGGA